MHNGDLAIAKDGLEEAVFAFLERINVTDYERITIFYGQDMKEADVNQLVAKIKEKREKKEKAL